MTPRHRARVAAGALGVVVVLLALLSGAPGPAPGEAPPGSGPAPGAPPTPGAEPEGSPGGGIFVKRNPFDIIRFHPPPPPPPAPVATAGAAPAPPPPPPPAAPAKPPPVGLDGTIAGHAFGVAFLKDTRKGETFVMSVGEDLAKHLGDDFKGTILAEVTRKKVVFVRAGTRHELELGDAAKGGGPPPQRRGAPASPPPPPPPAGPPPPLPEGKKTLKRGEVNAKLKNLGFLITQLSVQPFFQNGRPAGFRVSRVRPGSYIDKLGVRTGDIVQGVNGKPVTNVKDAIQIYNAFKTGKAVGVKILRGGQEAALDYEIE